MGRGKRSIEKSLHVRTGRMMTLSVSLPLAGGLEAQILRFGHWMRFAQSKLSARALVRKKKKGASVVTPKRPLVHCARLKAASTP